MADLAFLLLVAVFFAIAVLYVRACGSLAPPEPLAGEGDPASEREVAA